MRFAPNARPGDMQGDALMVQKLCAFSQLVSTIAVVLELAALQAQALVQAQVVVRQQVLVLVPRRVEAAALLLGLLWWQVSARW